MHSKLTSGLAVVAFCVVGVASGAGPEPTRVVAITARRFEFSPKEITLKQGETVTLRLTTEDVSHGFFVKPLGIDELISPGQATEVVVTPRTPGRYTTICDRFCGAGHGGMKMAIVVE
jgi:cytochrome c oxidase subunit II